MRSQDRRRRYRRRAGLALVVAGAVVAGWLATAPLRRSGEEVYTPDRDAYVSTAHPDANYGTKPMLRADATPKIRSYLRFRLRGLTGQVMSARLRLWSRSGDLTGYQVHRVASTSWDELSITSNNAPQPGDPAVTSPPFGAGLWVSADVTRLVQGGDVSLALTSNSSQNVTFESREGSHKPQLVVKTDATPAATRPAPGPPLRAMVEDAAGATAARYGTRDDHGVPMHTLKVIPSPAGGYLGVYHAFAGGTAAVRVATSTDLLHWRQRATLDPGASQPAIAALSDGGFVVAEEAHGAGRWLRFRYYPTLARLLRGAAARALDAPRTLAASRGAEGTPNIYRATLSPDLEHSTIDVGFHYQQGGVVDRQARGTLTGFSKWTSRAEPDVDASLERQGVIGNIGDRDHVAYHGAELDLIEARRTANQPWRVYLHEPADHQARPLHIRTAKGSKAFANPTVTLLRAPSGAPAAVVTLFLPDSGAARGEAGELVYYKEYGPRPPSPDPVIAAAGDVACRPGDPVTPTTCHQQATSELLVAIDPTAVLGLGDLQYERGLRGNFLRGYDPTWGRLKAITHPIPGNHEDRTASAGYYQYFGPAAGDPAKGWYSFDIGAWHLIALNSNCRRVGGCGPGSPQERWLRADLVAHPTRCTLAFWHHPRFSSGRHAGDPDYDAFWRALHHAGADVVLNAHDHHYERFAPQDPRGRPDRRRGLREFVVGTGGKSMEPFAKVRPNSEVRNANTFGVLVLTLHPGGYDWRFVGDRPGRFGDRGSGSCH